MEVSNIGDISCAVMILVGLPLFILAWTSFMPYLQMPSLEGLRLFTSDNYRDVFNFCLAHRAFANSITLGIGSGVIVMLFTAMAACWNDQLWCKQLFEQGSPIADKIDCWGQAYGRQVFKRVSRYPLK